MQGIPRTGHRSTYGEPKVQMVGRRFSRLKVLSQGNPIPRGKSKRVEITWNCICDCGTLKTIRGGHLRKGLVQSCGCFRTEQLKTRSIIHGASRSPEYNAYCLAKARCNDKTVESFPNYGGRGIKFKFDSFAQFYSTLGNKPGPQYSIDRIDNNGHYEPTNVRWATSKEQAANRRTKRIEQFTNLELSEELQIRGAEVIWLNSGLKNK